MADYACTYRFGAVALRYFNTAGCDPEGHLGESHDPETHLIPLVLREATRVRAGGNPQQTGLAVFGNEFATPVGTFMRNYVHVADICAAHTLAIKRLLSGPAGTFEAYNLGSDRGRSVMEVIGVCSAVAGAEIGYRITARRPGDPPALVASSNKARNVLGWRPGYAGLEATVRTAWDWMLLHPELCG